MTFNDVLLNWKTTGAGLVIAIAAFFRIFYPSQEAYINQLTEAIIALGAVVAAILAKDNDKTGTTAKPRE